MATPEQPAAPLSSKAPPLRVMIVESDPAKRERMVQLAREALASDIEIDVWPDDAAGIQFESLGAEDLLLAGVSSQERGLPDWFAPIVDRSERAAVILLMEDENEELATCAIQRGAAEVLVANELRPRDLARAVNRALGQRRLATENARLAEQLRRTNSELDHVVRALSHDMNANLMVLEDSVRQLRKSQQTESLAEVSENFAHVDACLRESHRYVDELATLTKDGRLPTEPERVELAVIARDVLFEQRALVARRGVAVTIDPRLPAVWCHSSRAKEIVVNLVRNALLHGGSEKSPQLAIVRAEPPEGIAQNSHVWIRIYDNGVGISKADRETIFEPGRRLAGRAAEGSGLGLSIVKKAVEQYGGKLCFDPLCREGCALLFSLPAAPAVVGPPHNPMAREKGKRSSRSEMNSTGPKSKPWR